MTKKVRKRDQRVEGPCEDCGTPVSISLETASAWGSIRGPGELVCLGCSSSRGVLVRKVRNLPDTLHEIRAGKFKK